MNNSRLAKPLYTDKTRAMFTQFLRYGLIGISLNTISYLLYLLATYNAVEPKVCMTVLYLTGVISNVLANRKWTFNSEGTLSVVALRAAIAYFIGYLINFLLLYGLADIYGYPHQLVQFLAIGVVAVFLFFTLKFFVFKREEKH